MGDKTGIEWTDATWNPIVGCSVVSPGCTNCYAMRMAGTRLKSTKPYGGLTQDTKGGPVWTGKIRFIEERLTQPLRWRKPRRVFVNSMSDLFHEGVAEDWIDQIFAVMALTPQHTYQVLTKRPERMRDYFNAYAPDRIYQHMQTLIPDWPDVACDWMLSRPGAIRQYQANLEARLGKIAKMVSTREVIGWPLANVWLGTSVEDQTRADERIPALIDTLAAVRFLSCEPLLGPVNLRHFLPPLPIPDIDWVIVGGESGPKARNMAPDWARDLRDQCKEAHVAFFMKQMGGMTSKSVPIPPDLQIEEYPTDES